MERIRKILNERKVLIGMVHIRPLPGTPYYSGESLEEIERYALNDAKALEDAGFDAVIFANEGDRPYIGRADMETLAYMTRVVSRVSEKISMPFGVALLIDPFATLTLAKAVDAQFVRIYLSGAFAGFFGLQTFSPGEILRHRKRIGAEEIAIFSNVTPHAGISLDTRSLEGIVDDLITFSSPEAILISGIRAGKAPDFEQVKRLKDAYPSVKFLVSTGVNEGNVEEALRCSDGVIVGTCLKREGILWNPVDPEKAKRFVKKARQYT